MRIKTLVAALLVLTCSSANALTFLTGNELNTKLYARQDSFEVGVAYGYILGIVDAYSGTVICVSNDATVGQLVEIVKKYLRNNPEIRHFGADGIVLAAMKETFPCASNK